MRGEQTCLRVNHVDSVKQAEALCRDAEKPSHKIVDDRIVIDIAIITVLQKVVWVSVIQGLNFCCHNCESLESV